MKQLTLFFLFYPLSSLISPILGLLSVMMCKAFVYRAASYMTSVSLFTNCLSFFICDMIVQLNGNYAVDI